MNQPQQNQQTQQQMPNPSMLNPQNQSMPQGPMGGMGGSGMGGGMPGHNQMGDSYSISQSQTINFTQQTLRQRAAGGK